MKLTEIFKRDTPDNTQGSENRSLTENELFAYNDTVRVTELRSMQLSAVFASVKVLAESVASLPWMVYQRQDNGKKRFPTHSLYQVIHDRPNEFMTSFTFRETVVSHLALWGNAYVEMQRDRDGNIKNLWPIPPDDMEVLVSTTGKKSFRHKSGRILGTDKIWHIPAIGFDGYKGMSPIQAMRNSIGLTLTMEEYGKRLWENDSRPRGVLATENRLTDEAIERMRASWENIHRGSNNAGKVAILEQGLSFKPTSLPPEDAQFLETRKFQTAEIARIFRIPLHMIGDLEKATFSNIEQQSMEFVQHTLRPWLVRIEQSANYNLFPETEREDFYTEFSVEGLLRGDIKSRYEAYSIGRQWGFLSINDIRNKENENALDDDTGNVYLSPLNMVDASTLKKDEEQKEEEFSQALDGAQIKSLTEIIADMTEGKITKGSGKAILKTAFPDLTDQQVNEMVDNVQVVAPTNEPETNSLADIRSMKSKDDNGVEKRKSIEHDFDNLFEEVATKTVKRERAEILRGLKKHGATRDVSTFRSFIEDYYEGKDSEYIRDNFAPVFSALFSSISRQAAEEVSTTVDTDGLEDWQKEYVDSFLYRYRSRSKGQLLGVLNNHERDFDEAVETRVDEWIETRPEKIGREENTRGASAVSKFVWAAAGYVSLRWKTFGDTCPHCRALDGKEVKMNQFFLLKEQQMNNEGQVMTSSSNIGHPPLHAGCDCSVVAGSI